MEPQVLTQLITENTVEAKMPFKAKNGSTVNVEVLFEYDINRTAKETEKEAFLQMLEAINEAKRYLVNKLEA
jgi:hypothetical protein